MSVVLKKEVKISYKRAMATANRFILENLPDRFSAGLPKSVHFPTRMVWIVPVLLTYPKVGILGEVGMIAIEAERENVVGWTPFSEMEALARQLYQEKKNEIEIAFS